MTLLSHRASSLSSYGIITDVSANEEEESDGRGLAASRVDLSSSEDDESEEESLKAQQLRRSNASSYSSRTGGVRTISDQFLNPTGGLQRTTQRQESLPTRSTNTRDSDKRGPVPSATRVAVSNQQCSPTGTSQQHPLGSKMFDFGVAPTNKGTRKSAPFDTKASVSISFGPVPNVLAFASSKSGAQNGTPQPSIHASRSSSKATTTTTVPSAIRDPVNADPSREDTTVAGTYTKGFTQKALPSFKMKSQPVPGSLFSTLPTRGLPISNSEVDEVPDVKPSPTLTKNIFTSSGKTGLETLEKQTTIPTTIPMQAPLFEDSELSRYRSILRRNIQAQGMVSEPKSRAEELRTAPLITWTAKQQIQMESQQHAQFRGRKVFPQYSVLGESISKRFREDHEQDEKPFDPILLNTNAPWSAFICGSQGSGKSHTLSCILEGCLHPSTTIGNMIKPLAGLMFHYDAHEATVCEAAHLCSAGVPVKVLVSPSNYLTMKDLYSQVPNASKFLTVEEFYLQPNQLNTERLKKLMAFSEKDGAVPLYMEGLIRILREMRLENQGSSNLNYREFRRRLADQELTKLQSGPLNLRLALLDSLLAVDSRGSTRKKKVSQDLLKPVPGALIILDLTDPFIDNSSACALFEIAMALFLSGPGSDLTSNGAADPVGKIVALDEAHNYLDSSASAQSFTSAVLKGIREQRHRALRVVIATQEPTINPALLDLCSMIFVHRFSSPEWLRALQRHVGGLSLLSTADNRSKFAKAGTDDAEEEEEACGRTVKEVFETIVTLGVGEALLFAPSAVLKSDARRLGTDFLRVQIRDRMSADGGRSVLAVG